MHELSARMLQAGWVLRPENDGLWSVLAPAGRTFHYRHGQWTPGREEVLAALREDEDAIAAGRQSRFRGTCRLTHVPSGESPSPYIARLCHDGFVAGHHVLRLRCGPDPVGDAALLQAGARRVETHAPWQGELPEAFAKTFHLLLAEHVVDVLPRVDRAWFYRQMAKAIRPDGTAFFALHAMEAMPPAEERKVFGDGYEVGRGKQPVFYKPYTPAMALREIRQQLGGYAQEAWTLYHEVVIRWTAHA